MGLYVYDRDTPVRRTLKEPQQGQDSPPDVGMSHSFASCSAPSSHLPPLQPSVHAQRRPPRPLVSIIGDDQARQVTICKDPTMFVM